LKNFDKAWESLVCSVYKNADRIAAERETPAEVGFPEIELFLPIKLRSVHRALGTHVVYFCGPVENLFLTAKRFPFRTAEKKSFLRKVVVHAAPNPESRG
jgi:hypothetical protein